MKHHLFVFTVIFSFAQEILTLGSDFFDSVVIPSEISIAVDESIFIKIKNPIDSQTECKFQAPGKKEINPSDSFVTFSDDKCGIRIDKVQKLHEGVWKLISTFKNSTYENSIKGTSVVRVRDRVNVSQQSNRIFASTENVTPSLEGYNLNYCYVSKNSGFTRMSEIDKMKCMIPQGLESDFRVCSTSMISFMADKVSLVFSLRMVCGA
jgi:hypothetical protein